MEMRREREGSDAERMNMTWKKPTYIIMTRRKCIAWLFVKIRVSRIPTVLPMRRCQRVDTGDPGGTGRQLHGPGGRRVRELFHPRDRQPVGGAPPALAAVRGGIRVRQPQAPLLLHGGTAASFSCCQRLFRIPSVNTTGRLVNVLSQLKVPLPGTNLRL